MTSTYRLQLIYVVDGEFNAGGHSRTARSRHKRVDRRIKRRQHKRITAEAVNGWYVDGADSLYEYLNMSFEFEAQENAFWEPEYDEREDYEEEPYSYDPYDYIDDGWASYHYDDGEDYWGNREVTPEDKRFIEREDIGKSLGEILEEIQQKQQR